MADSMKLNGIVQPTAVNGTAAKGQIAQRQPRAERDAGRHSDARTQAALDRLGSFLASGVAPCQDARRGTYLNITV